MLAEREVTRTKDMNNTGTVFLDPDQKSPRAQDFEERLTARIVGQERAVRRMSGLYQIFLAGMNPPNRPIGTMLFLGPTGSGKDSRDRGGSRSSLRRPERDRQDRLRGVSAFARDRETDWLASGIPGTSRNFADADPGKSRSDAHRRYESLARAVRRDRKGFGQFVAVAARHSRQSDFDARRQSSCRLFEGDGDHDLKPRRPRDVGFDFRRYRFRSRQRYEDAERH